jgi:hypothetical protein
MGDGETLLLVLTLLYLTDCLLWVRNQSVAFVSPWCYRWRVAHANSLIGNERGSLLFLNPLPPLGRIFLSHLTPVSVSPVGVCAFNRQALFRLGRARQSGQTLTFAEISSSSTDGAYLLINNQKFTKCATAQQARTISEFIRAMVDAAPYDRDRLVRDYVAKPFALDEAAARLRKANQLIRPIQFMCCLFFLFLLVVVPIVVNAYGLLSLIVPVAAVIVAFAVQISIMFYRAHKILHPHDTQERIESVIKMVLCPPASIRASDLLTKNLLSEYSPVVLAALAPGPASTEFVRALILDLQHPLAHEAPDKTSSEIISWEAATHLNLCLQHLIRCGFSRPEVLLAPPTQDRDSTSYCPRCRGQFLVRSDWCPDCPGVRLLAFPSTGETDIGGALSAVIRTS